MLAGVPTSSLTHQKSWTTQDALHQIVKSCFLMRPVMPPSTFEGSTNKIGNKDIKWTCLFPQEKLNLQQCSRQQPRRSESAALKGRNNSWSTFILHLPLWAAASPANEDHYFLPQWSQTIERLKSRLINSTATNLLVPWPASLQKFSVLAALRTTCATAMMTQSLACEMAPLPVSRRVSEVRQRQPMDISCWESQTNVIPRLPQFQKNIYTSYLQCLKSPILSRYNICFALVKVNRSGAKSGKTPKLTVNLKIYKEPSSVLSPMGTDTLDTQTQKLQNNSTLLDSPLHFHTCQESSARWPLTSDAKRWFSL